MELNLYNVKGTVLWRPKTRSTKCGCVFRPIVTDHFGIVTADFGIVTGHFGIVTEAVQ